MKNFFKRLLCDHKWSTDEREVESYYDYMGDRVRVFECKCTKCGKRKRRKYY